MLHSRYHSIEPAHEHLQYIGQDINRMDLVKLELLYFKRNQQNY